MSSIFQNRLDYFKKETSPTYLRIEMEVLARMSVPRIDVGSADPPVDLI